MTDFDKKAYQREYMRKKRAAEKNSSNIQAAAEEATHVSKFIKSGLPARDEKGLIMYSYQCSLCKKFWGASLFTLDKCPYCGKVDCNDLIYDVVPAA